MTVEDPTLVVAPAKVSSWKAVSAGEDHTCAISEGLELYCWGECGLGLPGGQINTA